jgi:hypothetical protein
MASNKTNNNSLFNSTNNNSEKDKVKLYKFTLSYGTEIITLDNKLSNSEIIELNNKDLTFTFPNKQFIVANVKQTMIDIYNLLSKTECEKDLIKQMLLDTISSLTHTEMWQFVTHKHLYKAIIQDVLNNVDMTLAIPRQLYKGFIEGYNASYLYPFERELLNRIIPFQVDKLWTCYVLNKKNRNSVATWALAQGCFVELKDDNIQLLYPEMDMNLLNDIAKKDKTNAKGENIEVSKVTPIWKSKYNRMYRFVNDISYKTDDDKQNAIIQLHSIALALGCTQDVIDDVETITEGVAKDNKKKASKKATKESRKENNKSLFANMNW